MKREVAYATAEFQSGIQGQGGSLVRERGVSVAQASRDLDVHENLLRKWVKQFDDDPRQAFPGHGVMKGRASRDRALET